MNIDNELRDALRRKQAPDDLVDRVLALARGSSERGEPSGHNGALHTTMPAGSPRNSAMRWLAAAAVLTLAVGGGTRYYVSQQQAARAERVRADLSVALQITNDALARVQNKMSRPSGTNEGRRTP